MTESLGRETILECDAEGQRVRVRRVRTFAALALLIAAALLLLPLRYTAVATLSFDVASQPPAASVRGVAQVLGSREMAQDVFKRLGAQDQSALAGLDRFMATPRWLAPDLPRTLDDAAGAALVSGLTVNPRFGGRVLDLAFTATSPGLASRVVQTYADAFVHLDAEVRADLETGTTAPPMRIATEASAPAAPDVPNPLRLALLVSAALALGFIAARIGRVPHDRPQTLDRTELPVQLTDGRSVTWMDAGGGRGLTQDEALARLLQILEDLCAQPSQAGQLVVLTADTSHTRSARCAIDLARALAMGDTRVALVALDGDAGDLAGLVSDPWAAGVTEMLFGVAGFGETIHRDQISRAHIIPPGRGARGGDSVATADRLALILHALSQTYDCVIVAAPPAPHLTEAFALAAQHPLLVCIEDMDAPQGSAAEAYSALASTGFNAVVMLRLAGTEPVPLAPAVEDLAPPVPVRLAARRLAPAA
ncbi:hypothetical protein V5F77_17265 [Xanthobacter sp. DSM 24535]|uniref:hypothetical protein n=1 Tax=Roseixanthobacter psychrophilus TaxID=3119917 RepID=UPI00372C951A